MNPRTENSSTSRHGQDGFINIVTAIVILGDIIIVALAYLIGFWIRFNSKSAIFDSFMQWEIKMPLDEYYTILSFGIFLLMTLLITNLVYNKDSLLRYKTVSTRIFKATFYAASALLCLSLIFRIEPNISRGFVVISYLFNTVLLVTWRFFVVRILRMSVFSDKFKQRVIIVSWNEEMNELKNKLLKGGTDPYVILGCLPGPNEEFPLKPPDNIKVLGSFKDFEKILTESQIEVVIFADKESSMNQVVTIANICEKSLVEFKVAPSMSRMLLSGLRLELIGEALVLRPSTLPLDHPINRLLKRSMDIIGGLIGLALSIPFIIFFSLLVFLESPGAILYRQMRMGHKGRNFKILKIRSMHIDAEKESKTEWGWTKDHSDRCLKVGRTMRKWSIDELPQFWNVIKGEMSLVGPRPEELKYIERFKYEIPHYNARHNIKPGVTGLAQIKGFRGDTDLKQRIIHDLEYLENWSLGMDTHILIKTLFTLRNSN